MAATFTFTPDTEGREAVGRDRELTGVLTIAGTYTAAGDVVGADVRAQAAIFGLSRFDDVEFIDAISTSGHLPRYEPATRKVRLFRVGAAVGTPLSEAAAAEAVAGTIRVRVRGK